MIAPIVKQTWVTSSTLVSKVGIGMLQGFLSCLVLALKAPDSPIKMNIHTSSWFVASVGLSCVIGFLIGAIVMDQFGRRIGFIVITIPAIIGMLLMSFTSDVITLFFGRAFCGITIGSTSTIGAVVIAEYTAPEVRGMFLNLKTACLNVGMIFVHILGEYFHWRTVAVVSTMPFIVSLVITYTWPESPSWLAEKKRFKESEDSFYWLRGKNEDLTREIKELIRSQKNKQVNKSVKEHVKAFFAKFKQKNFLKPTAIILLATFLLEASGRHFFPVYASVLVKEITSNNVNSFYYNVVIDILIIISGILASILIKVLGSRKLLFYSGFATVVILNLACLFMYCMANEFISKSYLGLSLFLFVLYYFLCNLGCTSVPISLIGEIFPLEHRAFGTSLAGYFISFYMTVTLKLMPYMLEAYRIYGAFAILNACMSVALIALYFLLPETKDRTLQEIEDYFENGRFRDRHVISNNVTDEELEKL